MSQIDDVNTPDWDSSIAKKTVLVVFWAPWCEACKVQHKLIESIIDEINIKVLKLNIDDNKWLSQKLGVRNIPTIIAYKNEIEIQRFDSLRTKEELIRNINKL